MQTQSQVKLNSPQNICGASLRGQLHKSTQKASKQTHSLHVQNLP